MCVCVLAGAGPGDAPQPGSGEYGHEAVRGFREAGLPPAAAVLPPGHLRKPAAALLQTRGTQRAGPPLTGCPEPGRSQNGSAGYELTAVYQSRSQASVWWHLNFKLCNNTEGGKFLTSLTSLLS